VATYGAMRRTGLVAACLLVTSTLLAGPASAEGFPPCGPFPPRHAFAAAVGLDGKPIWSTPMPITQDGRGIALPPLVDGATTYLAVESTVSALDSADGHVIWQARPGTLLYNIWRYGTVLAVLSDQVGRHATVTGYDAATGAVLWRYRNPGFGMYNVVVQTSGGAVAWIREDGVVQALDLRSGKLRWSHRVAKNQMQLQFHGASVTAGAGVVLFAGKGALTAFDQRTGKRRWVRAQLPEQAYVAVAGGVVALTTAEGNGKPQRLVAMSMATGKVLWQRRFATTYQVGVEATDVGFLLTGGVDPVFREYMLAARTGKTVWSAPAQLLPQPTSAQAIAGDDLLQLTFTYDLYRKYTLWDRDLRTGHLRWKVALHGAAARAMTVAASATQVYLVGQAGSTTTKGAIRAYSRSDGHALWSLTAPTSLWLRPAIGAGHLTLAEVDAGNACPA
jgi:outer membrane protein assembly factor BamB